MIQKQEFDRLEQFVNRLLAQFNKLREENGKLEAQLLKREAEIEELKTELSSADSARGDITSRVKGLIEQIEEWESTLAETEITTEIALKDKTVSDQVAVVADPVIEKIKEEEKDGGPQQSLFNVEPRPTNMDG